VVCEWTRPSIWFWQFRQLRAFGPFQFSGEMMAIVRFTTTCDIKPQGAAQPCGKRAEEYSSHPSCRYCGDDVCPEHTRPNTLTEADLDSPAKCVCVECCPEEPNQLMPSESWDDWYDDRTRREPEAERPDYDDRSADDFDGWEDADRAGTRR
jgi:hypothetical protein